VPWQHVADAGDAAVGAADHGEPFEGERRPGAIPQQVLETLKIARHVAIEEGDPDTRVDRKAAVLPGEHVGGGRGVEQTLTPEPADHAAADPFGERGQVCGGERPGGQERRRPVGAVRARQEDAVGDGRVQMGVAVEPGAEPVEKGDGAEPWVGGRRRGMVRAAEALKTEQRLDLIQKNPRHRRDGFGSVAEHSPQSLTLLAYVISSTLAAVGGMLFVLDINAAQPSDFGNFYELYAIAAAVLGGCSLRGGEGSILGLLVGSALMVVLSNMINLVHPRYQNVEFAIIGGVILAGVIADELVRRAARRRPAV
jgi:hypothetical protein